ncbi:hypothetical protein RHN82_22690 (plasmid) [Enterobacter cloacae complex sp. EB5]|nr:MULTISPECIES: hypothetical protein [Enterobacter cloacae complex]MCU2955337.1 hypothetical protein [Enterobacter hormaechei subsp. hoffmannii]MCU3793223.1 hypothetical protein [Enterobacter hormaechei subsp. steigerwaltii]WMY47382.1 hypothetical protein RHN82_22690 [Enterobacter cloacae complex sp. EB5]
MLCSGTGRGDAERRFVPALAVGMLSGALFRRWGGEGERRFVPALAVGM